MVSFSLPVSADGGYGEWPVCKTGDSESQGSYVPSTSFIVFAAFRGKEMKEKVSIMTSFFIHYETWTRSEKSNKADDGLNERRVKMT